MKFPSFKFKFKAPIWVRRLACISPTIGDRVAGRLDSDSTYTGTIIEDNSNHLHLPGYYVDGTFTLITSSGKAINYEDNRIFVPLACISYE